MSFRTTVALFAIFMVFGLVLLGVSLLKDETAPTGSLLEELSEAGVKAEDVESVEIERSNPAGTIKFAKNGAKNWRIVEPINAPADSTAVESVINALFKVRPTLNPELTANATVHGLAPAGLKVTLKSSFASSTFNIGDVTLGNKAAFVNTSTRERPMSVPAGDLSPLFKDGQTKAGGSSAALAKWVGDYRAKSVFPIESRGTSDDVSAIKLTAKGKELALSQAGSNWKFDSPAGWGEASSTGDSSVTNAITGVRGLITNLTDLKAQSGDDFINDPKDLKEYGLAPDSPELIRVELKIKGKDAPVVAYLGKKDNVPPPALNGFTPPATAKVFVRIEGVPGVIKASTGPAFDGIATCVAEPSILRDRDLLADDPRNRIDGLDVMIGGQVIKLRKSGSDWKLYGGPNDPQLANQAAVKTLVDLLCQPRLIRDFPAANDANFAGPEQKAEIKLWLDGIENDPKADAKAEPKLKGTPITLQFGKREGTGIFVRRTLASGVKTDFIVPDRVKVASTGMGAPPVGTDTDLVATISKGRLNYLDPTLKGFSPFAVTKLTIAGPTGVTELVHDKNAALAAGAPSWKFVKPDSRKDQFGDAPSISEILSPLSNMKAIQFIAEQPSEADLAKWGLDPKNPRVKVTLELEGVSDADKKRSYDFGHPTDDGLNVYSRQDGRTDVFLVPKPMADGTTSVDLRDRVAIRFDKSKVQSVEVQGWYEANRIKTVLKFERKGGTWVAENGFPVDPAKVDQLLGSLDGIRVKSFVPGGLKPEHKFPIAPEPGQPAQAPDQYKGLGITINLEGGKNIQLNIGDSLDGGTAYYLWTSTLPIIDSVVTIPSDAFKLFKEKPAAFAR